MINAATRFAYKIVCKAITDHKSGVEDFGLKSIGYAGNCHRQACAIKSCFSDQICLPKDKCELTYSEIVPGSGIEVPDDDEDWESSAFKRLFTHGFKKVIVGLLGNATFFPHGDDANYFDSDEDASEMVKMHFPGDHFLNIKNWI